MKPVDAFRCDEEYLQYTSESDLEYSIADVLRAMTLIREQFPDAKYLHIDSPETAIIYVPEPNSNGANSFTIRKTESDGWIVESESWSTVYLDFQEYCNRNQRNRWWKSVVNLTIGGNDSRSAFLMLALILAVVLFVVIAVIKSGSESSRSGENEPLPSVKLADIPEVFQRLNATRQDGAFAAFVLGSDENALNIQFSIERGRIGLDWVLIAPVNVRDERRFSEFVRRSGSGIEKMEMNDVRYLRVESGDLPALCARVLTELYGVSLDDSMRLVLEGFSY